MTVDQFLDNDHPVLLDHRGLIRLLGEVPAMLFRCRHHAEWPMEYVSAGSLNVTGYSPGTFVGRQLGYLQLIHPEDKARVIEAVATAATEHRDICIDHRLITASDEVRWVRLCVNPLRNDDDVLLECLVVVQITHQAGDQWSALYTPDQLPITALFEDRIRRALAWHCRGRQFALLLVVVDRYGKLQQQLGAAFASEMQNTIACRLSSLMAVDTSLALLAPGRFGILLEELPNPTAVMEWAHRIQEVTLEPVKHTGNRIYLTVSIGGVLGHDSQRAVTDVLQEAEQALQRAQSAGDGRCEFFYRR